MQQCMSLPVVLGGGGGPVSVVFGSKARKYSGRSSLSVHFRYIQDIMESVMHSSISEGIMYS